MAALITITVRVLNYLISFRHPKYVSNNSHCLHHQRFRDVKEGAFSLNIPLTQIKRNTMLIRSKKVLAGCHKLLLKIPAAAATYEESLVQQIAPML